MEAMSAAVVRRVIDNVTTLGEQPAAGMLDGVADVCRDMLATLHYDRLA